MNWLLNILWVRKYILSKLNLDFRTIIYNEHIKLLKPIAERNEDFNLYLKVHYRT